MIAAVARLTILMPLKRFHPRHLEHALRSVELQTSPAWRLSIVVDRPDLARFGAMLAARLTDSRVALVPSTGRGLAAALNTGMRTATTEFVAILLADDMWAPEAVAVLTRYIDSHPDVDLFHSSRRIIDGDGNPISGVHRSRDVVTAADFERGSPVKHLLCWRVSAGLAAGGLDESLDSVGPDDWDFPWTMAERGARFLAVSECLYLYRDHRDSYRLTTHLPLSHHKREIRKIMSKHGVDRRTIETRLAEAERGYLRQCLYRSRLDRWLKQRLRYDAREGWRDSYR